MNVQSSPEARGRRITSVVYGLYVLGVAAFVISSIVQVSGALFGANGERGSLAAETAPAVGAACGKILGEQSRAIEHARASASSEANADAARARYAAERQSSREKAAELEQACAADPLGRDALAALARFDRAAESHAVRTAKELSPVRLASQSFIRGDLP